MALKLINDGRGKGPRTVNVFGPDGRLIRTINMQTDEAVAITDEEAECQEIAGYVRRGLMRLTTVREPMQPFPAPVVASPREEAPKVDLERKTSMKVKTPSKKEETEEPKE
jgi:hypothetical protein